MTLYDIQTLEFILKIHIDSGTHHCTGIGLKTASILELVLEDYQWSVTCTIRDKDHSSQDLDHISSTEILNS